MDLPSVRMNGLVKGRSPIAARVQHCHFVGLSRIISISNQPSQAAHDLFRIVQGYREGRNSDMMHRRIEMGEERRGGSVSVKAVK